MPPIRSKLIESIRAVLYQNSEYRKKFLDKTGHRIYDGWIRGKKSEWIRLSFLGGARQVGRSCLFLQTPESRILLDCGVDVAATNSDMYPVLEAPEFDIKELDAIVLSHAHLDHTGLVPYLFKFGYKGPVYCTAPTRDIMAMLQLDLVKIQAGEGKEPIYTSEDVKNMVLHTICLDWEEVSDITPDVRLTFYNAGHILGSSMCHLNIGNGLHNILYTGDLKFARTNLLEPAATQFPRLETMIIESTYGGKDNFYAPPAESDAHFADIVKRTAERGGKVLMPVLGSGRAQEVIVIIDRLIREGKLPKIPIYVDGMLWDITAIHTAYPEYLSQRLQKEIFHYGKNPFSAENFKRVVPKEREDVINSGEPGVVIATSGMLIGGPSVEYLKALSPDKKNTLLFVGYQAEGTLGRRIQKGWKEIPIYSGQGKTQTVNLNMQVETVHGFSGHSDRHQMMKFISNLHARPERVICCHGDNRVLLEFCRDIHRIFNCESLAPKNLEAIRLK